MADNIELSVSKRKVTGKKVRFLRKKGITPLHLFGHNVESQALEGDTALIEKTITQAGTTRLIDLKIGRTKGVRPVMVREIQRDAIKGNLIHVDFYEVSMTEKTRVEVPLVLIGESPALKSKNNMLYKDMNNLTVECLPDKIPHEIEVDISAIKEADDVIRVHDIQLKDVEILNDPDLVIVKVSARPVEEVVPEAETGVEEKAAPAAESREEAK